MRLRVLGVASAGAALLSLFIVAPAHADGYPSWEDVEKAKTSESAARAEVTKISALIASLESAATKATARELAKAAEYSQASTALEAASKRADHFDAESQSAHAAAEKARIRFGQFISQLYISGGSDLTTRLLLDGDSSNNLLAKLGAMSQLTGHSAQLREQSVTAQNVASSAAAQASDAQAQRKRLAALSQVKLEEAQKAKAAADTEVTKKRAISATLYKQVAALKDTEESVEKKYYTGVAERNTHNGGGDGGSDITIDTSGMTADPAAAQAYARSRMSSYGWSGAQFQCLVDLWNMESGWRANAYNTSSGAYGIPQAWPAEKLQSAGSDWRTNAGTQINWGLDYISRAYRTPCGAWHAEMSRDPHWY